MYDDIIKQANSQLEQFIAPSRKVSGLYVDYFAKLTAYNLEAAKAYSDLSVEQLRSLSKVSDVKSLQSFVDSQTKTAKTISEKLSQDANTLAGLGKDFSAELQKVAQENVTTLSNKAAKAA
ncbi:MAG: TIGR01841 family phasin [Ectothiorhodospiraceae bacterium]|nr:TIGR01841 family phasin [Ectothiorhodospiraceae bacterium]